MTELAGQRLLVADFVTGLALVGLGATALAASLAMPTFTERQADPLTAPGIFPAFVSMVLLVLGLRLFLRSLVTLRTGHNDPPAEGDASSQIDWTSLLSGLLIMSATVALVGTVPFRLLICGFCLVYAVVFLTGKGSWTNPRTLAAIGFVTLLAGFLIPTVFERVFLVRLP